MSLLSSWLGCLKSDPSVEFTHISSPAAVGPTIQPDRQYLRVWLRSARFAEVRRWATKFHASVHTRFEFVSRAQPQREVVCVVATDKAFSDHTAAPTRTRTRCASRSLRRRTCLTTKRRGSCESEPFAT
jgi:hypothetical protein